MCAVNKKFAKHQEFDEIDRVTLVKLWSLYDLGLIHSRRRFWELINLKPLGLQGHKVPLLKDLIHICLETDTQSCDMTFSVCYVCSKYPYFISNRGSCQNRSYKQCVLFWWTPFSSPCVYWSTWAALHYSFHKNIIAIALITKTCLGFLESSTLLNCVTIMTCDSQGKLV